MKLNDLQFKNPLISLDKSKVKYVVIHHVAAKTASIEDIHRWHLENGWNGCGYNEYIKKDGTVYIGRGDNIGAQTKGYNSSSYGIAVEGNYDVDRNMPDVQLKMLALRIKETQKRFPYADKIFKHSQLGKTSCPGKHFPFNDLIHEVANISFITTVDEALDVLMAKDVINSPIYWKGASNCVKHLGDLLINVANKLKG